MTTAEYEAAARALWNEDNLQSWVLNTALIHGWRRAHFRPAKTAKGWRTAVSGDGKGFPDLILVRGCRMVVAELKRDHEKPAADQQEWLAAFEAVPCVEVYVWNRRTPASDIEGVLE